MKKNNCIIRNSIILLNLATVLLISCNTQTLKEIPKTRIILNDNGNFVFSKHFRKIEFIPLETNENNYFRDIKDVKVVSDRLFVFSSAPDNMVSIYKTDGKYFKTIRKVGNGPGEINFASSFYVDNCVRILDVANKKVTNYDWNGNLMCEYKMEQRIDQFSMLEGNRMVSYNILSNNFNNKNNVKSKYTSKLLVNEINDNRLIPQRATIDLNVNKFIPILLNRNYSITLDTLYYWDLFNDTIMCLSINSIYNNIYQIINFGNKRMPNSVYNEYFNIKNINYDKIIDRGYPTIHDFFRFTNGGECFLIYHLPKLSIGFKNNISKNVDCYNLMCLDIIHDNLIKEISFQNLKLIKYDGSSCIYFSWDSTDFLKTFDHLKEQVEKSEWNLILKTNPTLQNSLINVKKGDNPIIVKAFLN